MKVASMIKRIDNLGRIVLPKDVRKKLKLKENDEIEIIIEENNTIILKKYSALEEYEEECKLLSKMLEKQIEGDIAITDNQKICFCAKDENTKYVGKELSSKYGVILDERKIFNEKIMPTFSIIDSDEKLYAKIIVPIIVDSVLTGSIVMFSIKKDCIVRDKDIELVKFVASILESKMKI